MIRFTSLAFLLMFAASAAVAQTASPPPAAPSSASPSAAPVAASIEQRLQTTQDALRTVARQVVQTASPTDQQLQGLSTQLDPLVAQAQALIQELEPRLAATKSRLDQLGPAPAANAPAENPTLTADRKQQVALQTRLDSDLKQAKLLAVDADQVAARLAERRRDLFVNAVFAQSYSLFSPSLWSRVAQEVPQDAGSLLSVWRQWNAAAEARFDGWTWVLLLGLFIAIAVACVACAKIARRILARAAGSHKAPSRFTKALAALWVAFLTALAPTVGVVGAVLALRIFGLVDASSDPFLRSILGAVVGVTVATAATRGLLSPARADWRLFEISTPLAERMFRLVVAVVTVVGVGRILNGLTELVTVSLPVSVAIRGATSLAAALVLALGLRGVFPEDDNDDECLGPRVVASGADWRTPLRIAVWATIAAIVVAVALGYIAFGSFLIAQLIWVSFVGTALYVSVALANEGLSAAFQPQAPIGRACIHSLGIRRDSLQQFAILGSGAATLALCVIGGLLVLAPWGIESGDILGGLRAAFFGFRVGEITISLSAIVAAIVIFAATLLVTRWVQRWLDNRLLPATQLDVGLQNSIRTSLGYVGFVAAAALSLGRLGLDFQKLAIVAGALSVGIGFGLQSIVNNFVSGLIILWERAIRVGDLVAVGEEQGHVKRINVRATEIETFDRVTMIVPNSNLVSGVVKNWVRGDRIGRIKIPLSFNLDADPDTIRELLVACARDNSSVLRLPAPQTNFLSIDTNLKFELVCFVDDVERMARIKSDLYFELFRRLKGAGLALPPGPPPPVDVRIDGLERLSVAASPAP